MSTTLRAAAVAAISMAAVLAPSAAFAKAATIDDATGDVWENVYDEETQSSSWIDAGAVANVDADKVTVTHSDRRVQIKIKYKALKKNDTSFYFYGLLKDNAGDEWLLGGSAYPGENGFDVSGHAGPHEPQSGRGEVGCQGVKAHADFADDLFTVSAPRSCLGGPKWIKAHVDTGGYSYAGDEFHGWYDNAHIKGHDEDKGWTDKISKG